jgi:UDP-glucose-4-epimerase GalE
VANEPNRFERFISQASSFAGGHDYSRGNRGATAVLKQFPTFTFVETDIRDALKLATTFQQHDIEAVMHFAAYAYVGESCERPLMYYSNNVGGSLSLLAAMAEANISRLVFSSTCATYGEPDAEHIPIREDCPQRPINPYGHSKLMVEQAIRDFSKSAEAPDGFTSVILRYFNVAGSDPKVRSGEDHRPETHLIPLCLLTALGKRERIDIYGTDYPTDDGNCIRDYVHVCDLVDAHIEALPGAPIHLHGGQLQDFQSLFLDIVGCLAIPAIESIFLDLWEPGPFSVVLQMADAEVLFDNISHLGDSLVTFDFQISKFCRSRIFSHDAVSDFIRGQEITIGHAGVSLVGIDFFDGRFCMFAENGTVIEVIGIVDRSLGQGGRQDEAMVGVHGGMFFQAIVGDIVFDGPV